MQPVVVMEPAPLGIPLHIKGFRRTQAASRRYKR
jgi:hypothetical protein